MGELNIREQRMTENADVEVAKSKLKSAILTVKEQSIAPGRLIKAMRRDLRGDMEENNAWRHRLYAVQKELVRAVDACLRLEMDRAEVESQITSVGAEIVRNGQREMVRFPGYHGWFLGEE